MKANTTLAAVAAALSLFVAGLAQAAYTTYNWTGPKAANAPTNAYDWTDANWDRSPYPQDANADVFFRSSNSLYVKLPDNLTVYRIKGGSKTLYALAENVTCQSLGYSDYVNPGVRLFAHTVNGFSGAGYSEIAGDVTAKNGEMGFASDNFYFRFDMYANSAEPGRTNMIQGLSGSFKYGTGHCIFYAPPAADEIQSTWSQTKGSPYLKRVSDSHTLAVGTAVTGDGIPAGTFLRRNFGTGWIELSQPVTKTAAANALTFAAFAPDTYQRIPFLEDNGSAASGRNLMTRKTFAADKATMEIDTLSTQGSVLSRPFSINSFADNLYPWHVILHKVVNKNQKDDILFRYRADVEFAARTDGGTPGFPDHVVRFYDKNSTVDLTVGEGLNASILAISNLVGKLTKKGAGTLSTSLGNNTTATTGAITIEEGVFEVLGSTTGAVPALYKVTIKTGATLKLAENTKVSKFTAEAGAIVDGPGSLEVVGASISDFPQGVKFTGGASFTVSAGGGDVLTARPTNVTAADLGTPAFWVNTDDPEHDMTYEVSGSTTNVIRWNDCRAKSNPSVDWPFAVTNYLTPTLTTISGSMLPGPCVEMARADTSANVKTSHGLMWDRTITGIRAVFVVWNSSLFNNQGSYGGCILGWYSSSTSYYGDFARNNQPLLDSTSGTTQCPANVLDGELFVNGRAVANSYVVGQGYDAVSGNKELGTLIESYPIGTGAKANSFAYGGPSGYRSGGQRLYECLVYTNELTYAERMKVREYLSYKWFGTGASAGYTSERNTLAEVDAADVGAITVTEGVVDVSKLTAESGSFTKKGAGKLVVEDCVAPDATVSVEGGTLYLQSKPLTLDALPYPENVHVHVDATATNTITFKTISGKGECVKTWASVRGPSAVSVSAKTANAPLHKIVTAENAGKLKPGMPVVDMGEFYHETTPDTYGKKVKDGTAEYMTFTKSTDLRSVFLVMGSTHGGGQPIGADMGQANLWSGGWHRDRTNWTLSNYATSVYQSESLPFCFGKPNTHASIRLNGEPVTSPTKTGFSGDYDLLVGSTFAEAIKSDAFACAHYQNNLGGLELGEAILSTKWHSPAETKHVEAYLMKKWFGQDTVGCREPQIGTLKVAAGATVETLGGGTVKVGAVEGAGTVNAKLVFASDTANLKVTAVDGAIAPLVFGAATTFAGGTVTVDGDASMLDDAEYTLVTAASIAQNQPWTLNVPHADQKLQYALIVQDGRLALRVSKRGLVVIFF